MLDLTDDNTNTIKINNIADLGIGDYEFSLDNFNYQDDNEFTDLDPGVYTLYTVSYTHLTLPTILLV